MVRVKVRIKVRVRVRVSRPGLRSRSGGLVLYLGSMVRDRVSVMFRVGVRVS